MKAKMGKMYDKLRSINKLISNVGLELIRNDNDTVVEMKLVTLKQITSIDSLKDDYEGLLREEYIIFEDRLASNVGSIDQDHYDSLMEEFNNPRFWWFHDKSHNENSPFKVIRKRLLQFGGDAVCIPRLENTYRIEDELLIEFGQLWMCNRNYSTPVADSYIDKDDDFVVDNFIAKIIKDMNEAYVICHGYALGKDGIWRMCDFFVNTDTCELIDLSKYHNTVCFYGYAYDYATKEL